MENNSPASFIRFAIVYSRKKRPPLSDQEVFISVVGSSSFACMIFPSSLRSQKIAAKNVKKVKGKVTCSQRDRAMAEKDVELFSRPFPSPEFWS